MGLDVYLVHATDWQQVETAREAYDKETEEIYERHPDDQHARDAERAALQDRLGLGEWGDHPDQTSIEVDSKLYPDHMFKVGYFRSSYNNGGINTVLSDMGVPGLYEIFLPGDEYRFTPSWDESLARVDAAIALFDKTVAFGAFGAFFVDAYDREIDSKVKAIGVFKKQLEEHKEAGFRAYSCRDGEFYLDGIEIVAVIPGRSYFHDGAYVIFERDRESLEWYRNALEIVRETIYWILEQQDPRNYRLEWSS